jgi:hypothetical protein
MRRNHRAYARDKIGIRANSSFIEYEMRRRRGKRRASKVSKLSRGRDSKKESFTELFNFFYSIQDSASIYFRANEAHRTRQLSARGIHYVKAVEIPSHSSQKYRRGSSALHVTRANFFMIQSRCSAGDSPLN